MKIQKYIMVLVLLPLFFSLGYADNNVKIPLTSTDSIDLDFDFNFDENF